MTRSESSSECPGGTMQRITTANLFLMLAGLVAFAVTAQEAGMTAGEPVPRIPQIAEAIEDLAQRQSIPPSEVEVVSVEEVVWPDSSLGCPQPGMRYRQVLQDGMRIILRANGRQYTYHSGGRRAPFLCERKGGTLPAGPR